MKIQTIKNSIQNMKKIIALIAVAFIFQWSCTPDEKIVDEQQVIFSISDITKNNLNGGRVADSAESKSVLVTIKDNSGEVVANRKQLAMHKFGNELLSLPLTLKTTGSIQYHLTEFFVINSNDQVVYATPREGSELAHLVNDPLDIEFTVLKDVITTVNPEVLAVDENTSPVSFGYGQFGFKIVNTIDAVFSAFVKGANNFELTDAHLKIEGLSSNSPDSTVSWTYETDLEARANTIALKAAVQYRITATKPGYEIWSKTTALEKDAKTEIIFNEINNTVDVYIAGSEKIGQGEYVATYWKNGTSITLSSLRSSANMILVSQGDVYVTGEDFKDNGPYNGNAFYWKNEQKIEFSELGHTSSIAVNGTDVHVIGNYYTSIPSYNAAYWKNGERITLTGTEKYRPHSTSLRGIAMDGDDVYICGNGILTINQKTGYYPFLWKNGILIDLPIPSANNIDTSITSMTSEDGHVYICGQTRTENGSYQPIIWKDNAIMTFYDSPVFSGFTPQVVNGDIYLKGWSGNTGILWKNGVESRFPNSNIRTIITDGSTQYVTAIYRHPYYDNACYYLNGTRIDLSERPSSANSIFLNKK
jgi:hypothetical protein